MGGGEGGGEGRVGSCSIRVIEIGRGLLYTLTPLSTSGWPPALPARLLPTTARYGAARTAPGWPLLAPPPASRAPSAHAATRGRTWSRQPHLAPRIASPACRAGAGRTGSMVAAAGRMLARVIQTPCSHLRCPSSCAMTACACRHSHMRLTRPARLFLVTARSVRKGHSAGLRRQIFLCGWQYETVVSVDK